LADHLAVVDDGDRVARALDLVEEVRGEHHGATFAHERQDHVAHLVHASRVEPVHRLVQDQELRVSEETSGDPEALSHAH